MKRIIICIVALIATIATDVQAETFTYQNPITNGINPKGLRDCQVLRDGDWWYLTGTTSPFWEREERDGILNPGVILYRSKDLLNWESRGLIIEKGDEDVWYHRRFWAPEIHKFGGKYYATFNASNPTLGYNGQNTGYGVADNIEGPYTIVTADKPLCSGNDLSLFEDDDKKIWAFWNRGHEFGIGFAQIDLESGKFLTEPTSAIQPGKVDYAIGEDGKQLKTKGYNGQPIDKVEKYHSWDSIGIEGAYVIKVDGTYFLFYSSWTRGYEIGYATASKITGPWVKNEDNPFYGAQSQSACERAGLPYTQTEDTIFNQVGHNEIFVGVDGRYWLSCHGITEGGVPMLVIDPLEIKGDKITPMTPTHTKQTIKY